MTGYVSPKEHARRRAVLAAGLPSGRSWRDMAAELNMAVCTLHSYATTRCADIMEGRLYRLKAPTGGKRLTPVAVWWEAHDRGTLKLYGAARELLDEMTMAGNSREEIALAVQKLQRECRKAARSARAAGAQQKQPKKAPSIRDGAPATFAMRRCLGCSMEFESEWIGHRLCHSCKGRVANTGLVNEGSAGGRVRAIR